MKSLGGNGIFIREVWLKNRAVRVSGSNLKAARGCLKKTKAAPPQNLNGAALIF
jgi:hypothetical protein